MTPVPLTYHSAFLLATGCYGLAFFLALISRRLPVAYLLLVAILCNLLALVHRYLLAWPMLPMHLTPAAMPCCLGILWFCLSGGPTPERRRLRQALLLIITLIALLTLLFPKDFYLPFVRSRSLFAHSFLGFGVIGRSCLMLSMLWAGLALWLALWPGTGNSDLRPPLERSLRWAALGFILFTLSLFSGEIWSYLGWGTPVVWEDAALVTTMALWFFYACYLHLHLTRSWSTRARAVYASAGGLLVSAFSLLPDFGPYHPLF